MSKGGVATETQAEDVLGSDSAVHTGSLQMSRRKSAKVKPKLNKVAEHFTKTPPNSWAFVNRPTDKEPDGRIWSPRLSWIPPYTSDWNADLFAKSLQQAFNCDVVWFADANVFLAPTEDDIWKQFLSHPGRLAIAEPILAEVANWIDDPRNVNTIARDAIVTGRNNPEQSAIRFVGLPSQEAPNSIAFSYYLRLLGFRRRAYKLAEIELQRENLGPQLRQNSSNWCKDTLGARAQSLAKKSPTDSTKVIMINDEALIVLSTMWSLIHNREIVILTRDDDVFEQFYKFVWLLDTHYRCKLLSEAAKSSPTQFELTSVTLNSISDQQAVAEFQNTFKGDSFLVAERPSNTLNEILPPEYSPIPWHCCLERNGRMTWLTFMAEREFMRVLQVKSQTLGRSTDQFADRNCHIAFGPEMTRLFGSKAIIAKDHTSNVDGCNFSVVDYNLAMLCREQFGYLRIDSKE